MANLKRNICGLEFPNPVLTAAGPGAKDADLCFQAAKGGAGGIVTKTVSAKPADVPRPCMGVQGINFLNTELWSEHSVEHWVENEYPRIKAIGLPVIIGIGYTAEDIRKVAPLIKPYADAVEMSVHYVGTDMAPILDALRAAKEILDVPVFMKMSPHTDIVSIAKACEKAGADGIVLINSVGPCMAIDIETGLPIMGSKTGYGWMSGTAIRPITVRNIYDVYKEVNIPILGVGGVSKGADAIELMMAGASAVQVCTEAILKGPNVYGKIAKEMNDFLDKNGYKDVSEIIGLAHKRVKERCYREDSIAPEVDHDKCILCGICRQSCVYGAITMGDKLVIDKERCFGCGLCVTRCPKDALSISDR